MSNGPHLHDPAAAPTAQLATLRRALGLMLRAAIELRRSGMPDAAGRLMALRLATAVAGHRAHGEGGLAPAPAPLPSGAGTPAVRGRRDTDAALDGVGHGQDRPPFPAAQIPPPSARAGRSEHFRIRTP